MKLMAPCSRVSGRIAGPARHCGPLPGVPRRPSSRIRITASTAAGRRDGITLLEVLVSMAIFLGALTTILQLLSVGKRSEMMTRLKTEAVMRCEAKMAEVVSGVQPLESVSDQPFVDSEGSGVWDWSLMIENTSTSGLLQLTVRVRYVIGSDDEVVAFELKRYLRDPQLFIDAAMSSSGGSE